MIDKMTALVYALDRFLLIFPPLRWQFHEARHTK